MSTQNKEIYCYSNDAAARYHIEMINRALCSTWACPTKWSCGKQGKRHESCQRHSIEPVLAHMFPEQWGSQKETVPYRSWYGSIYSLSFDKRFSSTFRCQSHSGCRMDRGNIDNAPIIEMSCLMLSDDLATRRGIFIKGKARLSMLISVVEMMIGEGYHNFSEQGQWNWPCSHGKKQVEQ